MKKPVVHITDHALVRYLERVLLVDFESLRRRIGREIDARLIEELPGPCGVTVNGVTYKLQGKAVTTCVPVKAHPPGAAAAQMNKSFKPYLPGVLAMIAEEIGEEVAVRLAEARGGRAIYVPKTPKADAELSQIVGLEAAQQLSKLLGHGTLMVPCGNIGGAGGRRARIEALWRQGLSQAQIAAEVDVHTRTVERVVALLRDDSEPELPFNAKDE